MQDGTFKQGKGCNETGNNSTSTFITHSDKASTYLQPYSKNAIYKQELQPTISLYYTRTLKQLYFTGHGATTSIQNSEKKMVTSLWAVESSSHDRRRGRAWPRLLSRSASSLSGTPRPNAQVRHTTGAAASPIRASVDRPPAKPRAQDQNQHEKREIQKEKEPKEKKQGTDTKKPKRGRSCKR